jgi:hypothetical protein
MRLTKQSEVPLSPLLYKVRSLPILLSYWGNARIAFRSGYSKTFSGKVNNEERQGKGTEAADFDAQNKWAGPPTAPP